MHKIPIKDDKQYLKALGVLIKVGGTFQGRGPSVKPYLVVSDAQYKALVEARVVEQNGAPARNRGQKASK